MSGSVVTPQSRAVQRVLGGGVAALILFFGTGALLPARWETERVRRLTAPADAVRQTAEDLRGWPAWTPWGLRTDPKAHIVPSGPERGDGATLVFEGPKLGKGSLAIRESDAHHLRYTLIIDDVTTEGDLTWEPEGSVTQVRWRASGFVSDNPAMRWVGLVRARHAATAIETALDGLAAEVEP